MLQSLVICMAILMFSIMACDPRTKQETKNDSNWQVTNNDRSIVGSTEEKTDI